MPPDAPTIAPPMRLLTPLRAALAHVAGRFWLRPPPTDAQYAEAPDADTLLVLWREGHAAGDYEASRRVAEHGRFFNDALVGALWEAWDRTAPALVDNPHVAPALILSRMEQSERDGVGAGTWLALEIARRHSAGQTLTPTALATIEWAMGHLPTQVIVDLYLALPEAVVMAETLSRIAQSNWIWRFVPTTLTALATHTLATREMLQSLLGSSWGTANGVLLMVTHVPLVRTDPGLRAMAWAQGEERIQSALLLSEPVETVRSVWSSMKSTTALRILAELDAERLNALALSRDDLVTMLETDDEESRLSVTRALSRLDFPDEPPTAPLTPRRR